MGGRAEAAREQIANGTQVEQVRFVEGRRGLGAIEFDLERIEEVVTEAGRGCIMQLRIVAREQGARPVQMVDAGRFVAEQHEARLLFGDERVERGGELCEPGLQGGELKRVG